MQKVKLLSSGIEVEVEVNGTMIGLRSMTGQSQEIDISLKRLENASIIEKRPHKNKLLALEKNNKLKIKIRRMMMRKIQQLL